MIMTKYVAIILKIIKLKLILYNTAFKHILNTVFQFNNSLCLLKNVQKLSASKTAVTINYFIEYF